MSVSLTEQEITPDVLQRHNRKYAGLVKAALGILSSNSPDALKIDEIAMDPRRMQKLAWAAEEAISKIGTKQAELLRAKHGLLSVGDEARSFQEMRAFGRGSSSTVSRSYQGALNSLRYAGRLEEVKRVVYPERYTPLA